MLNCGNRKKRMCPCVLLAFLCVVNGLVQKSLLTSSVVCSVTIFGVQASLESFKKLFSRDLLSKGSGTRERTIKYHPFSNGHSYTVFENHQKWRIWVFWFWHFLPIFDLSGNTVWPQASGFQKLAKLHYFGALFN